jgi:hypothetical protein
VTLAEEIKSQGFWRMIVHPAAYDAHRIPYDQLLPILQKSAVRLRGWDFPHIGHGERIRRLATALHMETDWQEYREIWRFTSSGQFISINGIHEDWVERAAPLTAAAYPKVAPGSLLGAGDTVLRVTETFELAARLAQHLPGEDDLVITVQLRNAANRRLWMEDSLRGFTFEYVAHEDPPPFKQRYPRRELLGSARDLARQPIMELFQRFGWSPNDAVLRSLQSV